VAGKAEVNHPAEGNPVIRPDSSDDNQPKKRGAKKDQANPRGPISLADSNAQSRSPFRREKTPYTGTPEVPSAPLPL
jgi:hypothetical protein